MLCDDEHGIVRRISRGSAGLVGAFAIELVVCRSTRGAEPTDDEPVRLDREHVPPG